MSATRKRKQQEAAKPVPAAAAAPSAGFVILCTRKSTLIETDDECFVDTYGPEQDNIEDICEDSAKAWDGSWVWDLQPQKGACLPYDQPCEGSVGGSGRPRFFHTAKAAEEAAVQVASRAAAELQPLCDLGFTQSDGPLRGP
jgi:hypothetical protein